VVPTYAEFNYYFATEELGFSQMTISLLTLLGAIGFLAAIIIYKTWLSEIEVRIIIKYSIFISIFGNFMDLILILRVNLSLGIPDVVLAAFNTSFISTIVMALSHLPPMVLFAKFTPAHVEATMFAFLTSILNLSHFGGKGLGLLINSAVGVSNNNLS
jgi:hypothetical protein